MDLHNSGFSVVSQGTEYFDLQLASEPNSEDIIPSTEGEREPNSEDIIPSTEGESEVCQNATCKEIRERNDELTPLYTEIVVQHHRENPAAEQWYLRYMNENNPSQCQNLYCLVKRRQCYRMLGTFIAMKRIARLTEIPRIPIPPSILRISEMSRHGIDGVYSWLEQSPRGDRFARCKLCQTCINIGFMGKATLRSHNFSQRHQQHVIAAMQRRIPSYQF